MVFLPSFKSFCKKLCYKIDIFSISFIDAKILSKIYIEKFKISDSDDLKSLKFNRLIGNYFLIIVKQFVNSTIYLEFFIKLNYMLHELRKDRFWNIYKYKTTVILLLEAQSAFQIRFGIPRPRNEKPTAFHEKP